MTGTTPSSPKPATSNISGFVTSSVEGPPVQGATVSLLSNGSATGHTATSTGNGSFILTGIAGGTYDLLATKSGYASSFYQQVVPGTSNLSLPMFPNNGIGVSGGIPNISLGAGSPGAGASVSGNKTFVINVSESGTTPNAIYNIILRVGGNSVGSAQNSGTLTQAVNFNQYPAGSVTITIVAQDVADDVSSWTYKVSNSASGVAPSTGFTVSPLAQTFGQDLQILSEKRHVLWSKFHLSGNPDIIEIPENKGAVRAIDLSTLQGIKPSSTVAGTSIAVQVNVMYQSGPHPDGYKIYRATSQSGPYALLGSIPSGNCSPAGCTDATFNDFDPSFTPGQIFYYRAAAYSGSGTATAIPAFPPTVTILGPFHVDLVSPGGAQGSATATAPNTSTTPTLEWQASAAVGIQQAYDPFILSQSNNYTTSFMCGGNTLNGGNPFVIIKNGAVSSPTGSTISASNGGTTVQFPYANFSFATSAINTCSATNPLQPGVIYEWDLGESLAQGSPYGQNFLSISVGNGNAYTGGESLGSGSDNGSFFFTTTP